MNELDKAIKTPHWSDIVINGSQSAFIDQGEGLVPLTISYTEAELRNWVLQKLAQVQKSWDAKNPYLDWSTPDGIRIHVVFPPLTDRGPLVSLRRLGALQSAEQASLRWGEAAFSFLKSIARDRRPLLIAGATSSGKTTLLNDLLGALPESERILALEDLPELSPQHPHFVSLVSRPANADGFGEVSLRQLLKQTLRMRPDRLVLGECRGAEVLDLLQSLNTGHGGFLGTIHASSARDAIRRLELLCLLWGPPGLSLSTVRELIFQGLKTVVFLKQRKIEEVLSIEGREGDTLLMKTLAQPARTGIA